MANDILKGSEGTGENFGGGNFTFLLADESAVDSVFYLVLQRMKWMDIVGIKQWNVTCYDEVYPKEYYLRKICKGELYILKEADKIIGAAVLLENDDRWNDTIPAYYVHNLVTDVTAKGAGGVLLKYIEEKAVQSKKRCVRLDCSADNEKLNQYYLQKGYHKVGVCIDGYYRGNKREKKIFGADLSL